MQIEAATHSQPCVHQWRQRYLPDPFSDDPSTTFSLSYHANGIQSPTAEDLFSGRKIPVHFERLEGGNWEIRGHDFSGRYHATARHLELWGPIATYPIDLACMALWYDQHSNGLIIHGAGLRFGEGLWLCSGPSGSGKTTLTQLFPDNALCDELCGVLIDEPISLTSLPFWSHRNDQGCLTGIYLLEHASENRRSPLPLEAQFRRLTAQVLWPYFDTHLASLAFTNLEKLIHEVDIDQLGFKPTTEVASMFEQQVVLQ